ncbi:TetR family transcriptional regulator [Rufibacter glacialis]|uniref:TetR family transcriptional regulator n=1 Tax=Rufibacter glacialis TaxID=1259555 RepID=A0A5M8QKZ1_9BACT|nr:TetR family transcriptional regulator [Rufibacter glacialis]KAA6435660.1 TetR family transcriptional regulator [Rufibacter glacialis]
MNFKETILDEALVIFERRGIQEVSLEELLETLEISRGTLQGLAATKKELVQLCIHHSLLVRQAEVDLVMQEAEHPLQAFLQLLQLSVEEVHSFSPEFVQDLRQYYPRSWARLEVFMRTLSQEYLEPLLAKSIELGYLQRDLPPEMVVRLFINQLYGLLNPHLFPALGYGYQELFKIVVIYYLRGCATPLGQAHLEEFTHQSLSG